MPELTLGSSASDIGRCSNGFFFGKHFVDVDSKLSAQRKQAELSELLLSYTASYISSFLVATVCPQMYWECAAKALSSTSTQSVELHGFHGLWNRCVI